jgi:Tol biopolymer transport system component
VAAAGIFEVLLATLAFVHFREVPEERPLQEFEITTGTPAVFVAISPDGKQLAFVRNDGGIRHLYLRALDSLETHLAPDSEGASYPFWSPDSRNVGYFAGGKLRKFAPGSKLAFTICDVANPRGGAWGGDNTIIFGDLQRPLYRVAANGGSPVAMTDGRLPAFLPGGRRFLFNANGGLQLGSLDGGSPAATGLNASDVAFVPFTRTRGLVLGWSNDAVLAWPFDSAAGRAAGEPVVVAEQVAIGLNAATGVYSASETGILVYRRGSVVPEGQLRWISRTGERLETVGKPGPLSSFAATPDGRRIAVARGDPSSRRIWVEDVASGASSRLSDFATGDSNVVWSPDGQSIVYAIRSGGHEVFHRRSAGGGQDETLGDFGPNAAPATISPDGKNLVYSATGAGTRDDLWMTALEGERKRVVLLQTPASELRAQFSPDGRWLSYDSDQSGRPEIWVQPIPPDGSRTQISADGGMRAKWRGDGKEIYYFTPGGKVMAVAVKAGKTLEHGPPRELFTAEGLGNLSFGRAFPYQPSPDGQRFLVILPVQEQEAPATLTVVLSWMAGLKGLK